MAGPSILARLVVVSLAACSAACAATAAVAPSATKQSVAGYVVAQGIDESRIRARGYGETRPVADNTSAAGRAKNRRIEFRLLKAGE